MTENLQEYFQFRALIADLVRSLEANELEAYVSHLSPDELSKVRQYLLETIHAQRRVYEPCETTPCWDDAWFSSDMREIEAWSHRFIEPKSVTSNY